MFTNKTKKFNFKKTVYVILTMIIGKLLGFMIYGLLSIRFIHSMDESNLPVDYTSILGIIHSPLPARLFWLLVSSGLVSGFFLGLRWWRLVYVEHRHWRKLFKVG